MIGLRDDYIYVDDFILSGHTMTLTMWVVAIRVLMTMSLKKWKGADGIRDLVGYQCVLMLIALAVIGRGYWLVGSIFTGYILVLAYLTIRHARRMKYCSAVILMKSSNTPCIYPCILANQNTFTRTTWPSSDIPLIMKQWKVITKSLQMCKYYLLNTQILDSPIPSQGLPDDQAVFPSTVHRSTLGFFSHLKYWWV